MDSAYVSYSKAQELTDEQKSQARTNIGIEIPATLPNPNALTFTGAVNASYDGSSEVSVNIPDASRMMNKNNPTGTGSFSLNRKAGTIVGENSHAEGSSTTASGARSHAEGSSTTASGYSSHAEGNSTTASGYISHAEGFGTKASSDNQHVQGKYNIEDSSDVYADIIGNGTSTIERSNAATVDWSGNAWYAGDVYVGSTSGTNKDEGSKKLATEEYVVNSTASIDIPTALPNPQSLTFTGAAEGAYDGSSALTVEIPVGADGKSAYQYAQDGGYTGTEAEFSRKLAQKMLSGIIDELTPTQVYDAVSAGVPVKVQYIDSTYGLLSFTQFNVAESLNVIVSQTIVYYNGVYILAELAGVKSVNAWEFYSTELAQKADIPDIPATLPNPNALTFTGAVTGSYNGSAPMSVKIPTVDDVLAALPTWEGGSY